MEKNRFSEKLKKAAKNKERNDGMLRLIILVFIVVEAFFFTSNFTLPKVYNIKEPSKVGDTVSLEDYTFSFVSWDFAKNKLKGSFEIILELDNVSLEKDPDVEFIVKCGNKVSTANVERIIDNNLYVLKSDAPRHFTTAELKISVHTDDYSGSEKFYIDDKHTGNITSAHTDNEYRIYAAQCKIKGYKKQIDSLEKKNVELKEKIEYSVQKIDEFEKQKKIQTEEEIATTNEKISKISSDANSLQMELDENMKCIRELKEKIKMQNKALSEFN